MNVPCQKYFLNCTGYLSSDGITNTKAFLGWKRKDMLMIVLVSFGFENSSENEIVFPSAADVVNGFYQQFPFQFR